ncbi:MAG: RNA polymerase sigma factor [Lachnospiraceae bacterium]|nr:RNA polymerase sigma factor [Lachnospiraceae bacterium]
MEQFKDIYEKYYRKIYLFLLKMSGNQTLAEELTQETLYKAFIHIEQYEGRSSIYTWLCGIAKNNWLAEMRRQKFRANQEISSEYACGKDFEEEVLEKQLRNLMRQEILKLQEPYVTVCTLRIYGELSYVEISGLFGKSESWAKVTFFRGKTMLIERMEKYK